MKRTKITENRVLLFALVFIAWVIYAFIEFQFVEFVNSEGLIRLRQQDTTLSTLEVFLLTTLAYPLLEEIIFRLPLIVKLSNVVLSLLVATWYFSFRNVLFSPESGPFLDYELLLPLSISVLVVLFFFEGKRARRFLDMLGRHYQVPLVITSASLFALAHFWKIGYDSLTYAFLFILITYFTFGLFLSYVRIRLGFWITLFFHVLHNSVPYVIVLYYSVRKGDNLFIYI